MSVVAFKGGPEGLDEISFEDMLIASLNGESETTMGFPVIASIVHSITCKKRPDPSAGFSASQFGGCPRKIILDQMYETADSPANQYGMSLGTTKHKIIEDAVAALPSWMQRFFITEQRLHTEFDLFLEGHEEWVKVGVHGQFDMYYLPPAPAQRQKDMRLAKLPDHPILFDHKNTAKVPDPKYGPKPEHIWQVSIYAWLMHRNSWTYVPSEGRINYMDNSQNREYVVDLHTPQEVEEYLSVKLQSLAPALLYGKLPDRVGDEGQWQCGKNRLKKAYCPFVARCWPDGVGTERDTFVVPDEQPQGVINSPQPVTSTLSVADTQAVIDYMRKSVLNSSRLHSHYFDPLPPLTGFPIFQQPDYRVSPEDIQASVNSTGLTARLQSIYPGENVGILHILSDSLSPFVRLELANGKSLQMDHQTFADLARAQ